MRTTILFVLALYLSGTSASWFGSNDNEYSSWSTKELKTWLDAHSLEYDSSASQTDLKDLVANNWNSASVWTQEQYTAAQKSFTDIRDNTFESWDESRLREFLLEQGVVAPKGPREQLILLAKSKYRAYTNAASSFANQASATASTAVHGDSTAQASKSLSSYISQATGEVSRSLDDASDYVYSSWDDNRLRTFLEEKGVIKTKSEKRRDELLALMKEYYLSAADPAWEAWSDSYMREWLLSHGLIKTDFQKKRDALRQQMGLYYYNVNDSVYSTWSDSDLRQWLIANHVLKSDAEVNRDKMLKLVKDNYANAQDTIWGAWTDSDMRAWLIDNGYMRSDAQKKRDDLVKLMNEKYTDASTRTASYLTWPDARLRAYLREHGFSESALPTGRPGLLQETRIRWVQLTHRYEAVYNKIQEVISGATNSAEEKLNHIIELMKGTSEEGKGKARKTTEKVKSEL